MEKVVYRNRPRGSTTANNNNSNNNNNNNNRNSWSFPVEAKPAERIRSPVKESIYEPISGTVDGCLSAPRSRLRQRSVSNLNAGAARIAAANASGGSSGASGGSSISSALALAFREPSAISGSRNNGTISKGVDYIRMRPQTVMVVPAAVPQHPALDRAEFGNPDGHSNPESVHSTAEREKSEKMGELCSSGSIEQQADLYVSQNQVNDYKIISHHRMTSGGIVLTDEEEEKNEKKETAAHPEATAPAPHHRMGSGRHVTAGAAGSAVIKTEWTFLPSPTAGIESANAKAEESSLVRKGLLWVMRDRLFCRWHERYCILTRNYLHCFKKGSESSLTTQMGNFLFKVSLAEVMAVQWLDKRGTAIVCLNLVKEGRLLVKTSLDLSGWFTQLQSCVKETIGRRQTLLMDRKNGNSSSQQPPFSIFSDEAFSPATPPPAAATPPPTTAARTPSTPPTQPQPPLLHAGHPLVQPRDRSVSSRATGRNSNRFSMISESEMKLTAASIKTETSSNNHNNNNSSRPLPSKTTLAGGGASTTATKSNPVPVPVPYRERSVSFDRSRVSKVERDAKRRSYYPNHVTQV